MYMSILSLCHDTQNWVHVHPVSTDHPWDVSTTWLGTCGKFSWLDMIWKGTHLSMCVCIIQPKFWFNFTISIIFSI